MSRRRQRYPDPFFMLFPWIKVVMLVLFVAFIVVFIFRISETGGDHSKEACFAAIITAGAAGLCGLYPMGKMWRKGVLIAFGAIMFGSAIRLLIGGAGVAIITFFTQVNKIWYIFYVGIYYVLFLTVDMAFALWMLNHCQKDDQKDRQVHGNLWDMVG
jgi:hypothetical protein